MLVFIIFEVVKSNQIKGFNDSFPHSYLKDCERLRTIKMNEKLAQSQGILKPKVKVLKAVVCLEGMSTWR